MGITGRYDFKGLQKLGVVSIFSALSTTPLAWLTRGVVGNIFKIFLEFLLNFLANRGLILLNMGADYVSTKFEQAAFDRAMDEALAKLRTENLSAAKKKEIDDEVIDAFRKFAPFT